MRYYLLLVFMVLSTSLSLGAGSITATNIRFNGTPPQMVIDMGGNQKPKYELNYDEVNRLIFIEFMDTKAAESFVGRNVNGSYVRKVDVVRYPSSVGLFIHLQKNVDYKLSYRGNPVRFVIDFSKRVSKKEYTIVIDAGHGGQDPGAIGFKKYREKDVVFAVAKYLREELKNDFNIVMTRSSDKFIPLNERARMGNRKKADLFVSVHANSAGAASASGFEVFYYSKKSSPYAAKVAAFENSFGEEYGEDTGSIAQVKGETEYNANKVQSAKLADDLAKSYSKRLNMRNRGVHGANFAVLRGFDGPGILVETGFISNSSDVWKLKQPKYQKIMAAEIGKSIRNHFY